MLVAFSDFSESPALETDVCITGGGPAGITLAIELARSGREVILVESGGLEPDDDSQELAAGEISGVPYTDLDSVRLRYLGGSTNHWAGQSTPLQPIDFSVRDWVADSGWPIDYNDFAGYLPRAADLCRVSHEEWVLPKNAPTNHLEDAGFRPVLFRFPEPIFGFGEAYRRDLEKTTGLTVILGGHVLGFNSNETGSEVMSVTVGNRAGKRQEIRARTYVLATGGIENARQLLLSGPTESRPDRWPGLGNNHDGVGRYFMEHPAYDLGQVSLTESDDFLSEAYTWIGDDKVRLDLQLDASVQREARILNHSMFLLGSGSRRKSFSERMLSWIKPPDLEFRIRVRLEHAPYADSRVTLSDELDAFGLRRTKLEMRVGDLELATIRHVVESCGRGVGMADLGRLKFDGNSLSEAWVDDAFWQIHHAGGTRMSADPAKGVVDANCKVHGVANLYVAGSSVFPTSGQANPTMNFLALALRLAEHLEKGT